MLLSEKSSLILSDSKGDLRECKGNVLKIVTVIALAEGVQTHGQIISATAQMLEVDDILPNYSRFDLNYCEWKKKRSLKVGEKAK